MKVSAGALDKLAQLAQLDQAVSRLDHQIRTPEQTAAIAMLQREHDAVTGTLAGHLGQLEDAQTELARLTDDTSTVEQRMARNEQRLSQSSSAKDAQALEQETVSLRRRREILDERSLEVMERVDAAGAVVAGVRTEQDGIRAQQEELRLARDADLDRLGGQRGQLLGERAGLINGLPEDVVALYERQRAETGIGAAHFRARTCGGCSMSLTGADLEHVRSVPLTEIVQCPQCGCLLVRNEESGIW